MIYESSATTGCSQTTNRHLDHSEANPQLPDRSKAKWRDLEALDTPAKPTPNFPTEAKRTYPTSTNLKHPRRA